MQKQKYSREGVIIVETKTNLDESTIEALQKLVRYNVDACEGLKESAKAIDLPVAAELFRKIAEQRSDFAQQLQEYVEINDECAKEDGSAMAAVHRAWIDVRAAINGGDPVPVLCEAERGEDYIKAAYEDVLKKTAGSAMNDVLTKQYAEVKIGHDGIRELRDRLKE